MTICGAAGDLTKRKLIPALCNLAQEKLLPEQFAIVGFAVDNFTTESFRKNLVQEIPKYAASPIDPRLLDSMVERIYYVKGDFQDPEAYKRLEQQIAEADRKYNTLGNRLFYLAVAPRFFSAIVKMLGLCCLSKEENGRWARVIVEKPFGHDLASAKQLNQELKQVLSWKRDCAERHGLPLFQQHHRAAVESQLRRPRANHGSGNRRRRASRRILRNCGRAA
jgi:glucose-6-phosphate 1-dehydrogenase